MSGQKRKRVTRVCEFCKKRKIKCDRGSPCSGCVKYGNRNCRYIDQDTGLEEDDRSHGHEVSDELRFLKDKLKSLEASVQGKVASIPGLDGPKFGLGSLPGRVKPHMQAGPYDFKRSANWSPHAGRSQVPPVASEHDTINFYEGYCSLYNREPVRRRNFGPLSWFSMMRVDSGCTLLWDHVHSKHISFKDRIRKMCTLEQGAPQIEKDFSNKVTNDEGFNDVRLYNDPSYVAPKPFPKTPVLKVSDTTSAQSKNTPSGVQVYRQAWDEELELIQKIKQVLPKVKVVWLLYKRFFTNVYAFIPVIDEVVLKEQLKLLIGPDSLEDVPLKEVKIFKRLDFAHIGCLLLMIRFAYLSLHINITTIDEANNPGDETGPNAAVRKYLLDNPIESDVVDVAQACLNQFNLMRSANLAIMQLALMTRYYHMYAPEDGDGADGGDAQVFNAMLIQMAYSLGLHRDPDNFPDQCPDEKQNNLARKLWYSVLVIDLTNCMAIGTPLNINRTSYDTQIPYYKPGNENCINVELEKTTLVAFSMLDATFERLSGLMSKILNIRGNVSIQDLEIRLDFVEFQYSRLRLEFLEEQAHSSGHLFPLILKMKVYFHSNLFLITIYFHIFNYYEKRKNNKLAYHFLKKIIQIAVGDLMPFYFEFFSSARSIFKHATDFVVVPGFEMASHKSTMVLTGIYVRIKIAISELESRFDHALCLRESEDYRIFYEQLISMRGLLTTSMKLFRGHMSRLSAKYYYAWRITKAQNIIGGVLDDDEFYKNCQSSKTQTLRFDSIMLEELIEIFDRAFLRVKELKQAQKKAHKEEMLAHANGDDPNKESRRNSNDTFQKYGTATQSKAPTENLSEINEMHSVPSVGSVSSASSDVLDPNFAPNDQIDKLWISMMSNKKNDQNSNFGFFDQTGQGLNFGAAVNDVSIGLSSNLQSQVFNSQPTPGIPGNPGGIATPGVTAAYFNNPNDPMYGLNTANMANINLDNNFGGDPFENLPLEELFKDFS